MAKKMMVSRVSKKAAIELTIETPDGVLLIDGEGVELTRSVPVKGRSPDIEKRQCSFALLCSLIRSNCEKTV